MKTRLIWFFKRMLIFFSISFIGLFTFLQFSWKFSYSNEQVESFISDIKQAEELPEKFYELYNIEFNNSLNRNVYKAYLPYFIGYDTEHSTSLMTVRYFSIQAQRHYKNILMTSESLAIKFEKNLSRKQCLNWVANHTNFGYNADGLLSASQIYFEKNLLDLTDKEMATLVVMLRNPSLYNPKRNKSMVDNKVSQLLMKYNSKK